MSRNRTRASKESTVSAPISKPSNLDQGQPEGQSGQTSTDGDGPPDAAEELIVDELLVEEVSIDGMCGVY